MNSQLDTNAGRILYVDDDEAMVYLVQRRLTKQGWDVSAFNNPSEALAAFGAEPGSFQLVVSDYNMPNASGLDVLAAIRQVRGDVPTILTSGYVSHEVVQKAEELGIDRVVSKTDCVDDLVDAICRLLAASA